MGKNNTWRNIVIVLVLLALFAPGAGQSLMSMTAGSIKGATCGGPVTVTTRK
jgi:hypothetical protein